jgi:hypothetical protein
MQFESANPSVVRSIRQRDLLNTWLRALVRPHPLPRVADYQPECIADELPDMMRFDVEGSGDGARFVITQEGATLTKAYGNEHIDPTRRTNRYLDDAIGPERYARVLLPFGSAESVEQIIGSYKAISIEGHFKVSNLMGIRPRAVPEIILRAIIDQDIVRGSTHIRAAEDIVELD